MSNQEQPSAKSTHKHTVALTQQLPHSQILFLLLTNNNLTERTLLVTNTINNPYGTPFRRR